MDSQISNLSAVWAPIRAGLLAMLIFISATHPAFAQAGKPEKLECESLVAPIGMDAAHPILSWQIRDPRDGALQTAYQIQVASKVELLAAGKPDLWDSGRIESDRSNGVAYGGPALNASTRYFWRVIVWGRGGTQYPASDVSWWETGLLTQANWNAKWISYEEKEESSVRGADATWISNSETEGPAAGQDTHHNFRFHFNLDGPVRRGVLYLTAEDSASAWINGKQVMKAAPLPAWKQTPWKSYISENVTQSLRKGQNLLAVDAIYYTRVGSASAKEPAQTAMNAVLYVEKSDGSVELFKSSTSGWKAMLNASGTWQASDFDDSSWKNAILQPSPFGGETLGNPAPTGPVKALRRVFDVAKRVASARVYATALGAYKLSINGRGVGDQILAPGWTDYRQYAIYQTYDVTADLRQGRNAIGALLAPGWYSSQLGWFGEGYNYGDTPPVLRVELRIEHTDGSVDWVLTDNSWKAANSPILHSELYDGETYDARKAQPGWDTSVFNDRAWKAVEVIEPHEPAIVWQSFQPIRQKQLLAAKTITNPKPGVYILDFGQNFSGVTRIRAQGPAGTDVKLRSAEELNPDGSLYVANLRNAKDTDHFILAGKGVEEYQPIFTYRGFRYVEVSGLQTAPAKDDIRAVVFYTDAPSTSRLKTGNAMVNQLWSNILWGQRSNFMSVPTDCPQRDERLGWTADAQVFWRAASYNMDLSAFTRKFGADLRGTQIGTDMYGIWAPGTASASPGFGVGWSDAGVIIPWTSWIQTGDREVVEENWMAMEKYLAAIEKQNPDHTWKHGYGTAFADWLAPEGITPVDLIGTAYWAYDVTRMRQMAHDLGKTQDEQKYADLFEKIKTAFDKAYVSPDGVVAGVPLPYFPAPGSEMKLTDKPIESQTGYVLALQMNLLPDSLRPVAAQRLVDRIAANGWRLGTGFLGTPYLLTVLTDTGHADVAYRLLLNTQYPSWGYLVGHGATTIWERWNGDKMRGDPGMNSYNHYAYGAVADWIYRYSAGIDADPDDPGFHTILLHPNFDRRVGTLDFSYDSRYGLIHSSWSISGKTAVWKLTIPPNSKGELPLPGNSQESFKLDGARLSQSARLHAQDNRTGQVVYEVPAGSYQFEVMLP